MIFEDWKSKLVVLIFGVIFGFTIVIVYAVTYTLRIDLNTEEAMKIEDEKVIIQTIGNYLKNRVEITKKINGYENIISHLDSLK